MFVLNVKTTLLFFFLIPSKLKIILKYSLTSKTTMVSLPSIRHQIQLLGTVKLHNYIMYMELSAEYLITNQRLNKTTFLNNTYTRINEYSRK